MLITLRAARINAGMTQVEVAKHFGVCRQTVASWERAGKLPKAVKVQRLCDLYGVSPQSIKMKQAFKLEK